MTKKKPQIQLYLSMKQSHPSKSTILQCLLLLIAPRITLAVRKTRLTWVNGIAYGLHHMESEKHDISKLFGGKEVEYCHNPTSMSNDEDLLGYYSDLTQAGTQKLGRMTAEVNKLVDHLKESIAKVGKRGKVIHIAHSQGALLTALASKLLTPLEMSQIEVLAFGGAAALRKTPQTPFHRVINYYSVNDPLLLVVPQAAQALRSGIVGDNEEFCFLAPRIGDPIRDHALLAPTYAQALAWEGRRYQNQYQSLVYRTSRSIALLLMALLQLLSQRLQEFFKAVLRTTLIPALNLLNYLWTCLKERLIKPCATILLFFYLVLRKLVGATNDEYQPVQVAIDMAADQQQAL